jgi:hypothetical protein
MGNGLSFQNELKSLPFHPFHNDHCYLSSVWSVVRLVGVGELVASALTCFSLKGCLCQFADGCV